MYLKFRRIFCEQIRVLVDYFQPNDKVSARKLEETATLLKELNPHAVFVTTPTDRLDTLTLKTLSRDGNGLESLIEEIKKAVSAGK